MAVTVEVAPLLEGARELYALPRGRERFDAYIRLGTGGTSEMQLPIPVMNPMGKEHVLAYVEQLLALDAETIAASAAREAAERLEGDDRLRLAVVVADDRKGGWTNRYFTEFAHRYERKYEVQRGWATAILWTSETPDTRLVRARTLEGIYRTVDERRNGPVRTLRAILDREIRTQRFAGTPCPYEDAAYRAKVEPYLDADGAPIVMAALYGDEVAASLGYPPLGIELVTA